MSEPIIRASRTLSSAASRDGHPREAAVRGESLDAGGPARPGLPCRPQGSKPLANTPTGIASKFTVTVQFAVTAAVLKTLPETLMPGPFNAWKLG